VEVNVTGETVAFGGDEAKELMLDEILVATAPSAVRVSVPLLIVVSAVAFGLELEIDGDALGTAETGTTTVIGSAVTT
jgi:hypothetical protein